jgi:hypothetical protein
MPAGADRAVAFIQWEEYRHWIEAQKHTHWLYLERRGGKVHVFCNGKGWFNEDDEAFSTYLADGHVRSLLALN